jgi:hypothetical protein
VSRLVTRVHDGITHALALAEPQALPLAPKREDQGPDRTARLRV